MAFAEGLEYKTLMQQPVGAFGPRRPGCARARAAFRLTELLVVIANIAHHVTRITHHAS
jgi:hypothetical protein